MQGFLARSSSLSAVERIAAKRREERLRATDPTAMSAEAMDLRAALLDAHALRGRACRKAAAAKRAFDAEKELERRWHYENLVENTRLTTEMGAMRAANGRLVDEVRQLRAFVEAARKGDVREREAVARRRRNKWAEATRLASANADQRPGLDPARESRLRPDFNVRVFDGFDAMFPALLRELNKSNRFQKSAESTSIRPS